MGLELTVGIAEGRGEAVGLSVKTTRGAAPLSSLIVVFKSKPIVSFVSSGVDSSDGAKEAAESTSSKSSKSSNGLNRSLGSMKASKLSGGGPSFCCLTCACACC